MADNKTTLPTVVSLGEWHVGLGEDGNPEVRFSLTDEDEARAWCRWLFERCEDATDAL